VDEFVARENIRDFEEQLATEKDQAKRNMLISLLAEEKNKLEAALKRKRATD
jgi:hypothetical protein